MKILIRLLFISLLSCTLPACDSPQKEADSNSQKMEPLYPADLLSSQDQWSIMLANGETHKDLQKLHHEDYFYTVEDEAKWIVYKAPNGGITSPNSHNTRTELGQKDRWTPEKGGKLKATLKVMHVSTSGDARVAASYSVVVGQIHSDEGHENEPLKIFYKKFPGHSKGSVYWNYEINTAGDNSGRWDFSTPVWGYDMSVVGSAPDAYPPEPQDGIELGEEFSYEVLVSEGIMYLTFEREGQERKTFTKSLITSEYAKASDMPQQIKDLYVPIGQDGIEKANAYEGELQFFKQGAYNQTNGRDPSLNMVWGTGSETYGGDVEQQYAKGSYTEVWFRESYIGPAKPEEINLREGRKTSFKKD